jgi:hypothetical protein
VLSSLTVCWSLVCLLGGGIVRVCSRAWRAGMRYVQEKTPSGQRARFYSSRELLASSRFGRSKSTSRLSRPPGIPCSPMRPRERERGRGRESARGESLLQTTPERGSHVSPVDTGSAS